MSEPPTRFVAVNDNCLAEAIRAARRRVVYAAPGLGKETAAALVELMCHGESGRSLTLVLDADLKKAIPKAELEGWFDEFTAVMPSEPGGQQ